MNTMTPEQRIDAALESVLRASALGHHMPYAIERMRNAMRKVMSDSYIAGVNDCQAATRGEEMGNGS